jgi:hypothetical protein
MEAIGSSETSVLTRATRRITPGDGIFLGLLPSECEAMDTSIILAPLVRINLNHCRQIPSNHQVFISEPRACDYLFMSQNPLLRDKDFKTHRLPGDLTLIQVCERN